MKFVKRQLAEQWLLSTSVCQLFTSRCQQQLDVDDTLSCFKC